MSGNGGEVPHDAARRPSPVADSPEGPVEAALEDAQDPGVLDRGDGDPRATGRPQQVPLSPVQQSMSQRVAHGVSWTAVSRLGSQALQFAVSLVLARLLTPGDYGTLASVYVITGFAVLFFELGLSQSVVSLQEPTQEDLSTAFWINALGGLVFTGLLAGAGPLVAALFDDPQLVVLTPIVGLTFLFGLGSVHNALLQRELRFRLLAVIAVASTALGLVTTLVLAFLGAGAYSLALGPIVTSASASVLSWSLVPWRPTGFIARGSLPRLWRFSGGQLGFNVVNYWGRNGDNFLIARYVSDLSLGFYNKAYSLMLLPVRQVSTVLGRVMFPALASMGGDRDRVSAGYRRALRLINVITVPVLVGMAATAPGLVPLLWGGQWGPAVPLLVILSIAGVPQCLSTSVGWLYQSQNRTGRMFRMGVVTTVLGLVMMVVGLLLGRTTGVAWAILAREWLFVVPQLHFAGSLIGLSARRVVRDNLGVVVAASAMAVAVWFTPTLLGLDRTGWAAVLLQVAVGIVVYGAGARLLMWGTITDLRLLVRRRSAASS